jgi:hypothetical protein
MKKADSMRASISPPRSPNGLSEGGPKSVHSEAKRRVMREYSGLVADDRFGGKQVGYSLI